MRTNLFTYSYTDVDPNRNDELIACYQQNLVEFDKVHLITERLTYNEIFALFLDEEVNVIANSDIMIPKATLEAVEFLQDKCCFALTRWDIIEKVNMFSTAKFLNYRDSQDTWLFKGKVPHIPDADFCLGVPGCDNRIALLLEEFGYKITNPSKTLKTYHLQFSNKRNYLDGNGKKKYKVDGPYKLLECETL